MTRTRVVPFALAALCSIAIAACGDDDSSSSGDTASTPATPADTSSAGASSAGPDAVLECLTAAGVDAKDQSSNTSGETIGIDYSGGRTVISFEDSEEDAETLEGVAGSSGSEVLRAGTVVVSFADGSEATEDSDTIEGCVTG